MCGICGFVGPPRPEIIGRMGQALIHRGPDQAGLLADRDVSFAHRRLSIIDLQHGRQPLCNEDGSVAVVFNGEIYNHPQLRPLLEARGHRYATEADTESIVHAYEEYGTECVKRLDGMFAFVIWDRQRRRLFGARDRFGKKPLYYTSVPFGSGDDYLPFAFASEIKALREHPSIGGRLRLSREALVSYLLNDYVLGRQSIYRGIERLGAGRAFVYGLPGSEAEGFRQWPYWEINLRAGGVARFREEIDENEAGDTVMRLLLDAIQRRLRSDVPLGVLLSGGIDSSSIVALLSRLRPPRQIKTFSVGFDEPSFDETEYAEEVAHFCGTEHHRRYFTSADLIERLPAVVRMLDEPFADPSVLAVSSLCEFAREHVTVALSGDGGDELFAGYDPFHAIEPSQYYHRFIPRLVHRAIVQPASRLLPASDGNVALQFKVRRFLRGATVDARIRVPTWMGAFSIEQLARMAPDLRDLLDPERAYAEVVAAHAALENADAIDQGLYFFQKFYLADDILVKADRASMMHALEVRCPFLDTRLAEYVNALPNHYKLRGWTTKFLLKKVLATHRAWRGSVPDKVIFRKKKGFGIPVARWIRNELHERFRSRLLEEWPDELSMFDHREIQRLHTEHVLGLDNNYKELWALFMLAEWTVHQLN
jgi:asparagine synthase (glutamine-hydrolysing)